MTSQFAPDLPRKGLFVVFEGGDAVGKSTQVQFLVTALQQAGVPYLLTHEPGDTWLGGQIRQLVLDPDSGEISDRAEVLLFCADKAQHIQQVILPALAQGKVVVCDRYVDSLLAYQGGGRGLASDELKQLADWATGGLQPDLTVLLDAEPSVALAQIERLDRLEGAGLEFHQRVNAAFRQLAAKDPQRYLVLPALTGKQGLAFQVRRRLAAAGVGELAALGSTLDALGDA